MTGALVLPAETERATSFLSECLQPTTTSNIARLRTAMLTAFLGQMNEARIPYCLLNGFQRYPDVIASDVDFMVQPKNAERIAPMLREIATECGALLVQCIRHETGAWYFVLAKQEGRRVAYLHPDCSTDYRREGRLWMKAEQVLANRLHYKTFFVSAIADEFLYYLTKKILKRSISDAQWQRVVMLYVSCPEECSQRMRRFWLEETTEALAAALLRGDFEWMCSHLAALLAELRASVAVESWPRRVWQCFLEWQRRLERVANPTGLSVAVCGGTKQQRADFARALEADLRPAFRRTMICGEESAGDGLWGAMPVWRAKVRSTLVIRKREAKTKEWLVPDEIGFMLPQADAEDATRVALEYLAARLRRRMRLDESPSFSVKSAT